MATQIGLTVPEQTDAMDLSVLLGEEADQLRTLLQKSESVFYVHRLNE